MKFMMGLPGFYGEYSRETGVVFRRKPDREWQYMATGTGKTGVAVLAQEPLVLQLNHEGAFDERGGWRPLARVCIDFQGLPFTRADCLGCFEMVHDLRRSVIVIRAGELTVSVRAHMEDDLICVEWEDRRRERLPVHVSVNVPYYASSDAAGNRLAFWHDNGDETVWHAVNMASGMESDEGFADPLQNRRFGFAAELEGERPQGNGWRLAPAAARRLYLKAGAGRGLRAPEAFYEALEGRREYGEFIRTHEQYFRQFWERAEFSCEDERFAGYTAMYDLYRYYTAAASGRGREFPLRFQMDLLAGTLEPCECAGLQIHSMQTIQAYYGIFRNGDWDALEPLERDYREKLPFYRAYTKAFRRGRGLFIPYETNVWGSAHFFPARRGESLPACGEFSLYHLSQHPYQQYTHEHGFQLLCFLWDAAAARGEESGFAAWGLPALYDLLLFYHDQYRSEDGRLAFEPATSGETWYACKNPASWIAMLRTRLPRVEALARREGFWQLAALACELLVSLPELPSGSWRGTGAWTDPARCADWNPDGEKPERLPADPDGEVILPAEVFENHSPINYENPELYAVWPSRLFGVGLPGYELALRTWKKRLWKRQPCGWALDCIWAACLGLTEEAMTFSEWLLPSIVRFPCGLCREVSPVRLEEPSLPILPSMQGMGNAVCALYEMICQDRIDELLLLPAWPRDAAFRMTLFTVRGGRTEISYRPGERPQCRTQFPVKVRVAGEEQ